MTLLMPEPDYVAVARVHAGRWIADCPRSDLGCRNAEHHGADPVTQHVGGLTEAGFHCRRCGLQCPAQWPAPDERRAIEHVLSFRPVPDTRNWRPPELVRDLVAENVAHGVQSVRGPEVRA